MSAKNSISDLHGMLNSIRVQIQLLKASSDDRDRELQRRLRKATSQEQMLLAKLAKYTTN
jgi:hypothetical protein